MSEKQQFDFYIRWHRIWSEILQKLSNKPDFSKYRRALNHVDFTLKAIHYFGKIKHFRETNKNARTTTR